MKCTILTLTLLAATLSAAEPTTYKPHNWLYKASIAAVIGASAADIGTSMGRYETNPLLRGSSGAFGAKGIALKSAIVGSSLGVQWLLRHHNHTAATAANFGMAGTFGYIAKRNVGFAKIGEAK